MIFAKTSEQFDVSGTGYYWENFFVKGIRGKVIKDCELQSKKYNLTVGSGSF